MTENEIELNPVDHITTDAIGPPGQRVFYLQARQGKRIITILVEKFQVQSLALGAEKFLSDLLQSFSQLTRATFDYSDDEMQIKPPVDPIFRAGELGLSYDTERDLVILVIREIIAEDQAEQDGMVVRLWCTRAQLRAMCSWGLEVANRGRPICPYCGEPEEPDGHFCPKKNGRNR
ncbi:MAG: DUF3090 domain-containing protein [Anaerolineaceae bacterium]|nr:DUF3090 domain-containing protein [Anaerolineaceae bacterium]